MFDNANSYKFAFEIKLKRIMAKDAFHDLVKDALVQEDWKVTDNPLTLLSRAEGGIVTDLGAEKIIVAEPVIETNIQHKYY